MAINTFEVSGQLGKILGLSNVGVEWIERLEKLDQDTEIKYIKITLDSLKENLKEISEDQEDFDIGFTIVTLKGGKKVIIQKTETDIKIRTDLPVF